MPEIMNEHSTDQRVKYALARRPLVLDLTSDPWTLNPEEAAVAIVGRDVIHAGRHLSPDGGRRPVGVSIDVADQPITCGGPVNMVGTAVKRWRHVYTTANYQAPTAGKLQFYTGLSPATWPEEMIGQIIVKNEDERMGEPEYAVIKEITTTSYTDDTIVFEPAWTTAFAAKDKFSIRYPVSVRHLGLWASNGRKFWLIEDGTITLMMDLGDDDYLGAVWYAAPIGNMRMMFVCSGFIPRVIDFSEGFPQSATDDASYPGMIPPGLPLDIPESLAAGVSRGVYGRFTQGSDQTQRLTLSLGSRIKVRAVNRDTGAQSEFVQVRNIDAGVHGMSPDHGKDFTIGVPIYNGSDPGTDKDLDMQGPNYSLTGKPPNMSAVPLARVAGDKVIITSPAADIGSYDIGIGGYGVTEIDTSGTGHTWAAAGGITGYVQTHADGTIRGYISVFVSQTSLAVPFDFRWTHIEVWRTLADGGDYYLESTIEMPFELLDPINSDTLIEWNTVPNRYPCYMLDSVLVGQQQFDPADLLSGRLPPIGRQVAVTADGVTVIAGKADDDAVNTLSQWLIRGFYVPANTGATFAWNKTTLRLTCSSGSVFADYTWQDGDLFHFTSASGLTAGYTPDVPITSKVDNSNIELDFTWAINLSSVVGYIIRPVQHTWPTVDDEEVIHYSRADKYAPESFMSAPLRLSSQGDVFRSMVQVGGYVVVIMNSGVHLVYNAGGALAKETISTYGDGTPWPDSVVATGQHVVWAHPDGPKVLETYADRSTYGRLARIASLDPEGRMRAWFEEAYRDGDTIDSGVDELNDCIRFRRQSDGQALQFSRRTQLWTVLEDDRGIRYARSRAAGSAEADTPLLYTITPQGNAFEVNHYGLSHPYDAVTVQDVLDHSYTVAPTYIEKIGAFSSAMAGDVIRFRGGSVVRVVTAATASRLTFASVVDLAEGDEFIVGAVQYRIRSAPLQSGNPDVKTLEGLTLRALPGPRAGENWPDPPEGTFTLRSYRDIENTAVDERGGEIAVFSEGNPASHQTRDRVSALEGQGEYLQVEVEMVDARTDFRIAQLDVLVREAGQIGDASTED